MESLNGNWLPTLLSLLITSCIYIYWESSQGIGTDTTLKIRQDPRHSNQPNSNRLPITCGPHDFTGNASKSIACSFQKHSSTLTLFLGQNEVIRLRDSIRFHRNPASLCDFDVDLLIVVVSSIGNYENRNAIRDTWKGIKAFRNSYSKVKVTFVIPTKSDVDERETRKESEKYGDVLQFQFYEAAATDVLLETLALTWFKKFCLNAKFYLKTTDAFFLNPLAVKDVLSGFQEDARIYGRFAPRGPVIRSGERSTCQFFYPFDTYPTYMKDGTYLMTRDAALKLEASLGESNFFPLGDVYISGLTAEITGVNRTDTDRIIGDYADLWTDQRSLGYLTGDRYQMIDHWKVFSFTEKYKHRLEDGKLFVW